MYEKRPKWPAGLEQMHEDQSGDDVQHHQDSDEHHLQGEPLQKSGLQEDERGSAADGDKGRRGGHPHIDEPCQPVQSIKLRSHLDAPALPKQKWQNDQSTRPDGDRAEVDEFEQGCHAVGSTGRKLDQANQSPTPR